VPLLRPAHPGLNVFYPVNSTLLMRNIVSLFRTVDHHVIENAVNLMTGFGSIRRTVLAPLLRPAHPGVNVYYPGNTMLS